jgi:hypothetical protein
MKKRLLAILLLQVIGFGILSRQIGLTHSRPLPVRNPGNLPCGYDPQIGIVPLLPTMNDAISVTASGVWPDSCIPEHQSHQVVSNTVRIDAVVNAPPGAFCAAVVLDWRFAIDVGNLLTGSYRADLYIADHRFTQTPVLCASKSFLVVEQVRTAYLPIVTK